MKKRILLVLFPALALILALLPWGVVLHFANPEGEPFRELYSYFALTPFGYANFGPFLTAILICVLLVLGILHLVFGKGNTIIRIAAAAATVISLMPLMFGISYFSLIGLAITLCMAATAVISFWRVKRN